MNRTAFKRLFAMISVLFLLGSGMLAAPMAGAQVADAQIVEGQYACRYRGTDLLRFTSTPSCTRYEVLIDVTASLPFDFCVHRSTGEMRDRGPDDDCARYETYVVEDGTTSFFACAPWSTGVLHYTTDPGSCPRGSRAIAYVNLFAQFTKYACVEENLNPDSCDVFPAGPQNEIRQIGPILNTSGGFIDCKWTWEFEGVTSAVQSCNDDNSNADIEMALESLPGIDDVILTGGSIAGTVDAPIRIEFVGTQAQTDIIGSISINVVDSTISQDDVTVIDGSPASPGLNAVMPGGTVQIWEAGPATDPNDPSTCGPEVTNGPQPVDPMTGAYSPGTLVDGDYVVCATGDGAVAPSCEIVTIGGAPVNLVNNVDLPGMISVAITDPDGVNEVQSISQCSFGCIVEGGFFTLTFMAETTGQIPAGATPNDVEMALEGLSSIVDGDVLVEGEDFEVVDPMVPGSVVFPDNVITVTFQGQYAGMDVPEMEITNSLTGEGGIFLSYSVDTITEGSGVVQTLTADNRVSGGTFTLSFGGFETTALDFDATNAEIAAALNALPSIGGAGGSVTVTGGPLNQTPIEVNFTGVPNAGTNVLTVDSTNLT